MEVRFLRIRVHRRHGAKVINSIMELYDCNKHPFNTPEAVLPQDPSHLPRSLVTGSLEHRSFLFHINYYMRGGVDSNTAVKQLAWIYDEHAEFFDPYHAATHLDLDYLRSKLKLVGLNYRKTQTPEFWVENARRLVRLYDGDPGNIFEGVTTYEEACRRVRNDHKGGGFKGFQLKMVSMLTYFLMDAGFVSPFNFPVPVDIHVSRVTLANKIVSVHDVPTGFNAAIDPVFDKIREFYSWYSLEHGVDPLMLSNAVWMYSRLMCVDNPETKWEQLGEFDNRGTVLVKHDVNWYNPTVLASWVRSCGTCVVASHCKINIPAAPYYKWGQIVLGDPRVGPPSDVTLLPAAELAEYYSPTVKEKSQPQDSAQSNPDQIGFDLD